MKKVALLIAMACSICSMAQDAKRSREETLLNMAYAFAKVESNGNEDASNGCCIGWLQITPICVKEANRILGYECFFLDDRKDKVGSYSIFKVIMNEKNKELDLKRACEIWNPRGGNEYYTKVKKAYEELTIK